MKLDEALSPTVLRTNIRIGDVIYGNSETGGRFIDRALVVGYCKRDAGKERAYSLTQRVVYCDVSEATHFVVLFEKDYYFTATGTPFVPIAGAVKIGRLAKQEEVMMLLRSSENLIGTVVPRIKEALNNRYPDYFTRESMHLNESVEDDDIGVAIPQQDRARIIQHMIDSVSTGTYWDVDAKMPDGSPMDGWDDGEDMASTWEWGEDKEEGHYNPEGPHFADRLTRWAHARYDEVLEKLVMNISIENGLICISRIMRLPDWNGFDPNRGVGIYWTFDRENAEIDGAPWGKHTDDTQDMWVHGLVHPSHVDWYNTFLANMDWMSGDREHELRLKKGSPIHVKYVSDEAGIRHEIGTTYNA
jgi:hypothetical protein